MCLVFAGFWGECSTWHNINSVSDKGIDSVYVLKQGEMLLFGFNVCERTILSHLHLHLHTSLAPDKIGKLSECGIPHCHDHSKMYTVTLQDKEG